MTVRFLTPASFSAVIRFSGLPDRPKPPDIKVMPSNSSPSSAARASGKTFCTIQASGFFEDLPGPPAAAFQPAGGGTHGRPGRLDLSQLRKKEARDEQTS